MKLSEFHEWTGITADIFTVIGILGVGGWFVEGRKWWRNYWKDEWLTDSRDWDPEKDTYSDLTDPETAQFWSETRGQRLYFQLIRFIVLYKQDAKNARMKRIKEAIERQKPIAVIKKGDSK